MLKVLITGATGFIGYHLIEKLYTENIDITIITSQEEIFFVPVGVKILKINFFTCENFDSILKDIDIVYHLLWTTNTRINQVHEDLHHNVLGGIRFLESCIR